MLNAERKHGWGHAGGRSSPSVLLLVPLLEITALLGFIILGRLGNGAAMPYVLIWLGGAVAALLLAVAARRMQMRMIFVTAVLLSLPVVIAVQILGSIFPGLMKDVDYLSLRNGLAILVVFASLSAFHLLALLAGRFWGRREGRGSGR